MIRSNSALGFAVKNKVSGLDTLRKDREIVKGAFDIDIEDNPNDGFDLLAKRLASQALFVFAAIKENFKRDERPLVIDGVAVKVLREGKSQDVQWLNRETVQIDNEGTLVEVVKLSKKNEVKGYKSALIGSMSTKKEVKILDIEFNEGQKGYPKLIKLSGNRFFVEISAPTRRETHDGREMFVQNGKIVNDYLAALELFQSFGGKIETKEVK